ncbi:small-conductance mechanosensitive channel [Catalinimonas alkaloidigena]|uniref:mechanosensitive ion channel family protein n=1 Tax=Catalinimonas alkaloidigena TaxID=1075417 RepID=UPI002404AB3F|nr:mechanosensitive ion channel domain-containing protein [Catalinimonas alkaloidigena]MDF9800673.1 small-conductance mechanosensitive channel [Catalinimonas alkaloidigena]
MNQGSIAAAQEIDRQELLQKESRKRVYFILKFLLLLGIMYMNYEFQDWFREEGESAEKNIFALIIRAVLFYLSTHLLVSLARIVIVYFYIRRKKLKEEQDNVVLAVNRIATLISIAAFVAALFLLFDIKWETFFTSFSLVAVASVLLTKDYISNTVNGMIFMASDRFLLGDYIKVGNHEGKVINITLSSVHLRTEEGDFVAIPNTTVYNSDITNLSRREQGLVHVDLEVKTELLKDTAKLMDQLIIAAQEYERYIKKNSFELVVRQLSFDKVQIRFLFKLKSSNPEKEREIRRHTLREASQMIAKLI